MQKQTAKKDFDVPNLLPKHDDKVDAGRYFPPRPLGEPKPWSFKRRVIVALVGAYLLIALAQGIVLALNGFFGNYTVHTAPIIEIKLHWPFSIEKRAKPQSSNVLPVPLVETVQASESAHQIVLPKPEVSKIIDFIWAKESGRGTAPSGWHINCRTKGKWNEIGYGGPDFCFDSKEQGMAKLTSEISNRLEKNGLVETLCVYNLGFNRDDAGNRIPHENCKYYQQFIGAL